MAAAAGRTDVSYEALSDLRAVDALDQLDRLFLHTVVPWLERVLAPPSSVSEPPVPALLHFEPRIEWLTLMGRDEEADALFPRLLTENPRFFRAVHSGVVAAESGERDLTYVRRAGWTSTQLGLVAAQGEALVQRSG